MSGHDCEDFKEKLYDTGEDKYYWVCSECGCFIEWIENDESI